MMKVCQLFCMVSLCLWGAGAYSEEVRQVEGVSIIGNNELPQSIIIVPWKQDEIDSTPNLPQQSLLDERFPRIERQELLRSIQFYQSLQTEE